MNSLQQRKLTIQEPDPTLNASLLCNARTGSPLAYRALWARLRERDIRERDIRERNIRERDIRERDIRERDNRERHIWERDIGGREIGETDMWETFITCRFAE
jgi:hypothetical protein